MKTAAICWSPAADEPSHELEEEIRIRCSIPMRPVLALPRAINQAIAKYYAPGMRDEPAAAEEPAAAKAAATKSGAKKDAKPEKAATKSPPKQIGTAHRGTERRASQDRCHHQLLDYHGHHLGRLVTRWRRGHYPCDPAWCSGRSRHLRCP
ncbi:MAG UNVERIFIED_CONTAM: hypothetical protein LVR18_47985 [Planctomycetaceae bacterium]